MTVTPRCCIRKTSRGAIEDEFRGYTSCPRLHVVQKSTNHLLPEKQAHVISVRRPAEIEKRGRMWSMVCCFGDSAVHMQIPSRIHASQLPSLPSRTQAPPPPAPLIAHPANAAAFPSHNCRLFYHSVLHTVQHLHQPAYVTCFSGNYFSSERQEELDSACHCLLLAGQF